VTPNDKKVEFQANAQEIAKQQADYQDQSVKRLDEVKQNVEAYYNTNPAAFNDYNTFKKFFSYDQRAGAQRQVLDTFWKNKQKPTVDLF